MRVKWTCFFSVLVSLIWGVGPYSKSEISTSFRPPDGLCMLQVPISNICHHQSNSNCHRYGGSLAWGRGNSGSCAMWKRRPPGGSYIFPRKGHCSFYGSSNIFSHKFVKILPNSLGHQGSGTEQLCVHLSLRFWNTD